MLVGDLGGGRDALVVAAALDVGAARTTLHICLLPVNLDASSPSHDEGSSVSRRHAPPWTAHALGAVADEAALRAAVPTLRRFVMHEEAADLDAVMLRVGFATPAQFRALLAPGGVTVCTAHEGNARPHVRRCKRLAGPHR